MYFTLLSHLTNSKLTCIRLSSRSGPPASEKLLHDAQLPQLPQLLVAVLPDSWRSLAQLPQLFLWPCCCCCSGLLLHSRPLLLLHGCHPV